MKHPRQSSYLNKVMLKKKGSTPGPTTTENTENTSESKPSDKASDTQPSSRFIEKIKNLPPGSTFGQSSAQDTSDNQSQVPMREMNDYINARIKAPR